MPNVEGSNLTFPRAGSAVLTMVAGETRTLNWAVDVASRLKGAQFPIDKAEAMRRLEGLTVRGRDVGEILDEVDFPVDTPAVLMHRISENQDKGK